MHSLQDKVSFDSVIIIIRNPFHALWNCTVGTKHAPRINKTGLEHIESHGPESFGTNREWSQYIYSHIKRWVGILDWLMSRPEEEGRTLVVLYEDLVKDGEKEVKRMLEYLHFNITGNTMEPGWNLGNAVNSL